MGGFLYWRSIQVDPQLARIALLPLLVEQDDRDNPNLHAELVQPVWQAISRTRVFHPVVVGGIKDYDDFFYMHGDGDGWFMLSARRDRERVKVSADQWLDDRSRWTNGDGRMLPAYPDRLWRLPCDNY